MPYFIVFKGYILEKLDFETLFYFVFKRDYAKAAEFFGKSESSIRRWVKGNPCPVAYKLLLIHYRGYLPYCEKSNKWVNSYFDKDLNIVTPWGTFSYAEAAMAQRVKWSSRQNQLAAQNLRNKLDDVLNGTLVAQLKASQELLVTVLDDIEKAKKAV